MTFDELKLRLDRLDQRLDKLDDRIDSLLESVGILQRNSLKVLGAGSLLGGVVIFILSRAVGL